MQPRKATGQSIEFRALLPKRMPAESGDTKTIINTKGTENEMTSSDDMSADDMTANSSTGSTEADTPGTSTVGGIAGDILRAYIERIERLEEEKKNLAADIREVYAEAKGNGFEPKIMRKVVSLRKMEQADRLEEEELLDLYRRAVGV